MPIVQGSRTLGSRGGSVALYSRDDLTFKIPNDLTVFYEGEFETLFVEITSGKKNTIVVEVYRVSNADENKSLGAFEGILEKVVTQQKYSHWHKSKF